MLCAHSNAMVWHVLKTGKKEIELGFLHWIITAFINIYKISPKECRACWIHHYSLREIVCWWQRDTQHSEMQIHNIFLSGSMWSITLWINTHSGLVWIHVFSSSSWKSLFYHCELQLRPEQSEQLSHSDGPEFMFTVHCVGTSCKSPKHWHISIFCLCNHPKTLNSCARSMDAFPYVVTALSATLK